MWTIFLVVIAATLAAIFFAWPKAGDKVRVLNNPANPPAPTATSAGGTTASATPASATTNSAGPQAQNGNVVLTVSGYIINRERIEISPRFMGMVKWIGVKKGDAVTDGQVVVLLDDTEFKARLEAFHGPAEDAGKEPS